MSVDKKYLINMSEKDRKYVGTRPLIVLKPFSSNIDPDRFYSVISQAISVLPRFSSKAIELNGQLFLQYEDNCFRFNVVESQDDSFFTNFEKTDYSFRVYDGHTDDYFSELGQPLTGFTLTNFPNNQSVLSFSCSHALGDVLAIKMLIFTIAQILSGKPVQKVTSAGCFPFELEADAGRVGKVNTEWQNHPHQGHQSVRDGRVKVQHIPKEELSRIENIYNGQVPEIPCSVVDIVCSMIIKETAKSLVDSADFLNFKIPVDMRSRDKTGSVSKTYIGNAYYSVPFTWTKDEIDNLSLYELISQVRGALNSALTPQEHLNKDEASQIGKPMIGRQYIIGVLGNLSRLYKTFGENSLGKFLTISSDPFSFGLQRVKTGYIVQAYTSNEVAME